MTRFSLGPSLFCRWTAGRIFDNARTWFNEHLLWWAGSVTVHALVLSTLLLIGYSVPMIVNEAPKFDATVETAIPEPPVEHFEVGETPIEPTELTTETLALSDAPSQMAVDEQVNTVESEPFEEAGGGMASAASDAALGGMGFDVKAVGPGARVRGAGGLAGKGEGRNPGSGGQGSGFGGRGSGVRKAMLGAYGGTKGSERAVAAALNWIARHQNADGSWSLGKYKANCKDTTCTGKGGESSTAATAMALLPFFAAGQTHTNKGPYKKTIQAGLYWMAKTQKSDGDLRSGEGTMYSHGLSTICLSEAYGLSGDKMVGSAAQRAINFTVAAQDPNSGGWWYEPRQTGGDTSVVGWQVMSLKSGLMAGLTVPSAALEGAAKFLVAVGDGEGHYGYDQKGAGLATSAVGVLCMQYLGTPKNSPIVQGGVRFFMGNMPITHKHNCYYYYYATQVMHNVPGADWDVWNRQMRKILIDSQVKSGCAAGSWNPEGDSFGQDVGGRIMVTSLNALTLEVYYRYLPLYRLDGKAQAPK